MTKPDETSFWQSQSNDVRDVYEAGRDIGAKFGRPYLLPASLLLAVLRSKQCPPALLPAEGTPTLERSLEHELQTDGVAQAEILFAKGILQHAMRLAELAGDRVRVPDIVVAILDSNAGSITRSLAYAGIDHVALRYALTHERDHPPR